MEITLLGTGCPSVDHKRFGPSNLVSTKTAKILVDCGSGITQRLHELKVSSAYIDALLFTHLHSDHAVDLYQLIISSWHSYRVKPWKIYGPIGTKKFVKKIMEAWADERKLRISYEARASAKAFEIQIVEFKSSGNLKIKDIKIKYFEVDHKPVKFAYGFCFINNKKKLTISGDTKPCENLMKYAQKSDVLLHEVFIEGEILEINKMRTQKTLHNVQNYHTTSSEVGKVAFISRVKKLVLTHFWATSDRELCRKEAADNYSGEIIIGEQGLTISI